MHKLVFFCLLAVLAPPASLGTAERSTVYPNELRGFEFYAEHLKPLRPYVSNRADVIRVLGPDERMEFDGWQVFAFFVGGGSDIPAQLVGSLAEIEIRPKRRVSLLNKKFPAIFAYGGGSESEGNVPCDVYTDTSGLEYWIYSKDSNVGKKGDLMKIVYGPAKSSGQSRAVLSTSASVSLSVVFSIRARI